MQLPQQCLLWAGRYRGNEGDSGDVCFGEAIIAGCDAAPVFEAPEHALDDVATAIGATVEGIGGQNKSSAKSYAKVERNMNYVGSRMRGLRSLWIGAVKHQFRFLRQSDSTTLPAVRPLTGCFGKALKKKRTERLSAESRLLHK
mgnify:CR=1 FL=1